MVPTQIRRDPYRRSIAATVLLCLFTSLAFPQDKPKLKDFGSSLKKLKWDPKQNAAVETKTKSKSAANSNDEADVVRVETSLVVSDVLVLDAQGQPVKGLTDKDFLITEDGKEQTVGMISPGDESRVGRSIVLIMDYSGSLFRYINMSVDAAKTLVDQLGPRDRMAVVTDDIKLLVDFTQDKDELKSKLETLKKKAKHSDAKLGWFRGHSHQFSALMAALRELFTSEDERPVIIFQTDGDELTIMQPRASELPSHMKAIGRQFSLNDVYKTAERSKSTIYTVIPGVRLLGLSKADQEERLARLNDEALAELASLGRGRPLLSDPKVVSALQENAQKRIEYQSALALLATITGGWTEFLEQPSQANDIYSRIVSDINMRYIVSYYPTNKDHDGKRRKVSITVRDHPEYMVMGHKAYYAPGPD